MAQAASQERCRSEFPRSWPKSSKTGIISLESASYSDLLWSEYGVRWDGISTEVALVLKKSVLPACKLYAISIQGYRRYTIKYLTFPLCNLSVEYVTLGVDGGETICVYILYADHIG